MGLFSKNHSSRFYFILFYFILFYFILFYFIYLILFYYYFCKENESQTSRAELASCLCPLPHTPHLTFWKHSHKGLPTCRDTQIAIWECVGVGGGCCFSAPCCFCFHLNHPSSPLSHAGTTWLTPAAAVENDIDSLSSGNIWHGPGKEKLSSSQETGENWWRYRIQSSLDPAESYFLAFFPPLIIVGFF